MEIVLTALGVVLIVAGLDDMFHTLLHPTGRGALSRKVFWIGWRLSRRTGDRVGGATGPGAMALVGLLWVALQVAGWALVYLPHLPGGFRYSIGVDPAQYTRFAEALYVSLVTLTTLGFGDVVPTNPWVRLASPLEALTGFALLTAAVSWFTQVYPTLARRRTLALELSCLADIAYAEGLGRRDPASVARILDSLNAGVVRVCVDLLQNTETFYFRDPTPATSLARQLPYAALLGHQAVGSPDVETRDGGHRLIAVLEALSSTLKDEFVVRGGSVEEVLHTYAAEHGTSPRP